MLAEYAVRGLKAGLVAGVVFGLFVALVGNPAVGFVDGLSGHDDGGDHAAAEAHHQEAAHDEAVPPLIKEAVSILGGIVMGALLGVVVLGFGYYFLEPAIPGAGDTKSYLLAAAGFVTVSGAPWAALPPVAPGAEQSLPTDVRIAWYAGMMAVGAVACGLSGYAYNQLADVGRLTALAGAVVPFALIPAAAVLAPENAVTTALPAELRAAFRGVVVAGQLGLWLSLASAHAWLVRRAPDGPLTDIDLAEGPAASTAAE